jgi:hypothetical protein
VIEFLMRHQFGFAVGIYWIFSAAVSAMPEPGAGSGAGYVWAYRFLHTTAGNITTAFGGRIPGLKTLMLPILVFISSCAVHYVVRPGALNTADSAAYDTLLAAESVINQARVEKLSPEQKDVFNTVIRAYNVARESWLTYRDAIQTNAPADAYFAELNRNLADLTTAIGKVREPASASPTGRSNQ